MNILIPDGEHLESGARYDLKDRITHSINPPPALTPRLYDRNNKLLKEISPYGYEPGEDGGAGTTYAYDSRGNRIRVTNALGEMVREFSYNLQNQPVMQKDTYGNRTECSGRYGVLATEAGMTARETVRDIAALWRKTVPPASLPQAASASYSSMSITQWARS